MAALLIQVAVCQLEEDGCMNQVRKEPKRAACTVGQHSVESFG
jgi:hypothetical protein